MPRQQHRSFSTLLWQQQERGRESNLEKDGGQRLGIVATDTV